LPLDAKIYLGGGYWRHELIGPDPGTWPASWSQMERVKFFSSDRRATFKFEGLGKFGQKIRERALCLAEAGFSAPPADAAEGFACYPFLEGRIVTAGHATAEALERLAAYCAFRRKAFATTPAAPRESSLGTMVWFNVAQEFGVELDGKLGRLDAEDPAIVDGRMMPHEWVRTRGGRLMKCDGASHGDDHFFPGPATDIAWGLAGAIVEWNLDPPAAEYFLQTYRAAAADPRPRLAPFLLAYAVFRLAYCKMAADAMRGSEEEPRLRKAYRYYRRRAEEALRLS
jgi:hypothetical protein